MNGREIVPDAIGAMADEAVGRVRPVANARAPLIAIPVDHWPTNARHPTQFGNSYKRAPLGKTSAHPTQPSSLMKTPCSSASDETRPACCSAIKLGAHALGALAVGAMALGALAIGSVCIGRFVVGRARFRKLQIDELVVGKLSVTEELKTPLPDATP
jgi:hypothetical protein